MCLAGAAWRHRGNGVQHGDSLAALQAALTNAHDCLMHASARMQVQIRLNTISRRLCRKLLSALLPPLSA
jgi:hypothetical protein